MSKRIKTKDGLEHEREDGALRFFGYDDGRAVDAGPADATRYKPGARLFHVYKTAAESPS